ncbi:hypothetical protein DPMN_075123 [Dreissena polymorpha]|uniref:Uncharacterized protein n=1 Tax=Dreissena polymorpha TaxID=45954 RepID=A0A9D3YGG9_DREPO|nr:hypothetical protein DPMN_075123 [Dreissena polymorpha]
MKFPGPTCQALGIRCEDKRKITLNKFDSLNNRLMMEIIEFCKKEKQECLYGLSERIHRLQKDCSSSLFATCQSALPQDASVFFTNYEHYDILFNLQRIYCT